MTSSFGSGSPFHPRLTRRRLLTSAGWGAAASLTGLASGCASVPTQGPVEQVSPNARLTSDPGVRIDAESPRPGMSPELVVAGFMSAMASLEPDHAVARQYLTSAAAQRWRPASGTQVIDGDSQRLVGSRGSELVTAPLLGSLDAHGLYTAADGRMVSHDFGLRRVQGEWRIDNPPAGVLITESVFTTYFTDLRRWFVTHDGQAVVPETLRVPYAQSNPTAAVAALLAGPSAWLAPAVQTAVPAGARLTTPAVAVGDDGIATVSLDDGILSLGDAQRQRLVAQLAWTLRQFSAVGAVRVQANGQTFPLPGASDGTVSLSGFQALSPVPGAGPVSALAVRGRVLGQLATERPVAFHPITGALSKYSFAGVTRMAQVPADGRVVWTNRSRTQLWVGDSRGAKVVWTGEQVGQPVVATDASTWVAAVKSGTPVLLHLTGAAKVVELSLSVADGATVRSLAVSPDGARAAAVLQQGSTATALGLLRIGGGRAGGWRALPLSVAGAAAPVQLEQVAWIGPSSLVILGRTTPGGSAAVFTISDDGAEVTAVGPSGDRDVVQLATVPRIAGTALLALAADGSALQYDDAWRWTLLSDGFTSLTLGT